MGARWTIGHELALLVLATLLPFAVVGLLGVREDYRAEQQRIQARALRQARDVAADVDRLIELTPGIAGSGAPDLTSATFTGRLLDLVRQVDVPEGSSILVVDGGGVIVARRTEPEKWIGRSALDSSVVREALRAREGIADGDFVDGRRRLSGFATAARVPWHVVVGIATEEAYGTLQHDLIGALTRLALAGVTAGVVAWILSRRLTRPMRELAVAARAFGEGDLSRRTDIAGPEEIAALGRTLNRMAEALEEQVTALRAAQTRERQASADALDELRRLHSEFIAVAAHELRTPVAAAKSYAELLLRDESEELQLPAATRRQALERLDGVCDRLARLVRSLLGASRIQAGGLEVARVPFDVTALVARVTEEVAESSDGHDVVLRTRPARLATALGDADRVEDVLVNLLVNATKYSPPGSSVYVDVVEENGDVEVVVSDEGPGVPEEEQSLVFERFMRGRRTSGGGVGLGLYIARAYVEAMGGTIGVRSGGSKPHGVVGGEGVRRGPATAPGKGASFWFRLPRTRASGGVPNGSGAAATAVVA